MNNISFLNLLYNITHLINNGQKKYDTYSTTAVYIASINQCGRWDLNPHARNEHKILSLARLPVPTLPQTASSLDAKMIIAKRIAVVNIIFKKLLN